MASLFVLDTLPQIYGFVDLHVYQLRNSYAIGFRKSCLQMPGAQLFVLDTACTNMWSPRVHVLTVLSVPLVASVITIFPISLLFSISNSI